MFIVYFNDFFKCFVNCQGYVTGGQDGVVVMWDKFFEQCLKAFKVEQTVMNYGSVLLQDLPPIRSIHTDEGRILIGTGNDEVMTGTIRSFVFLLVSLNKSLPLRYSY